MRHAVVYLLLVALVASLSGSTAQLSCNYVDTPACYTSAGGCDFLGNIWDGNITNCTTIDIKAPLKPITLFLSSTTLQISGLRFGFDGSQVNLVLNVVNIVCSDYTGVSWGGDSTLVATLSSIMVHDAYIYGGNITLDRSGIYAENLSFSTLVANNSVANATGSGDFGYLYLYNSNLDMPEVELYNYSEIYSSVLYQGLSLTFKDNNTAMEIHNCNVTISTLSINEQSKFSVYSGDSTNYLRIDYLGNFFGYFGSEIFLGDNVIASFGLGNIHNLTFGDNVTLSFGDISIGTLYVYNIQQDLTNTLPTTINIVDLVYLGKTLPILVNVVLSSISKLRVYNLYLTPGSTISGAGELVVLNIFDCPTCIVQVGSVGFDSSYNETIILNVNTINPSMVQFIGVNPVTATVNGDVDISTQYGGIEFTKIPNKLVVKGAFVQHGGFINVTYPADSSVLLNANSVVLENAIINVDLSLVEVKTSQKYPLVNTTTNNLSVSSTNIKNSNGNHKLSLSIVSGELFFGIKRDSYGSRHKVFFAIFGTLIGVAIIVAAVWVWRKKFRGNNQYVPIH